MQDTENSPIHRLVAPWLESERRHTPYQVPQMREALYAAALEEIRWKESLGRQYDPNADQRFRFAVQYLECCEGTRTEIDSGVKALAEMLIGEPPPPSRKDIASNCA